MWGGLSMSVLVSIPLRYGFAVGLSVLGAVLFGLAAVRQHGAVRHAIADEHAGERQSLAAFIRMMRRPAWLAGMAQAVAAAGAHIAALALAPIMLVQPIGVLAVPVTVVASAVREHRKPSPGQVAGSTLSVCSIAGLTLLLVPSAAGAGNASLPSVVALVVSLVAVTAVALAARMVSGSMPALVRCAVLATTAAALFGLNSVFLRTVGEVLSSDTPAVPLLVTALLCIGVALPVGVWSMQTAYISGSPHVVICCLTLVDPVAAVALGQWLLHEGATMGPVRIALSAVCVLAAAGGVVLLSRTYPVVPAQPAGGASVVDVPVLPLP